MGVSRPLACAHHFTCVIQSELVVCEADGDAVERPQVG